MDALKDPGPFRPRTSRERHSMMDDDLEQMSREQLIAEVKQLRSGIREHRDSSLHDLCWHQPALWGLLPEKTDPVPVVPAWPQFMRGCVAYRQSLDDQAPEAPRSTEPYQR
jgi:hypothetical protein